MAEHVRQLIRQNAVALAAPFVTTASEKRARPTSLEEVPFCAVILADESSEQGAMGARQYDRTVAVVFRVIVSGKDGYEDELDAIFANIEKAFAADLDLGGVFLFSSLRAISSADDSDEGEDELMSRDLVFTGIYRTAASAPASPLNT